MKKAILWSNIAALALIWGLLILVGMTVRNAGAGSILIVGLLASLAAIAVVSALVWFGFYLAILIRAYWRGEMSLSKDVRRWFVVCAFCLSYVVLGFLAVAQMRLPEPIDSILAVTMGLAILVLIGCTFVFFESLTHAMSQALQRHRAQTERQ